MTFNLCAALFSAALLVSGTLHAADFVNSIGMEFNTLPASEFYIGSCPYRPAETDAPTNRLSDAQAACLAVEREADVEASDDEFPLRRVNINKPFQIGVHEVTLAQFRQFIIDAGRSDLLTRDFFEYNNQGDRAAVTWVSWDDAQAFVRWLNQKEPDSHYSLPTEAQWEYAARAGTKTAHYFKGYIADYAWYHENAGDHQHEVGQKTANPFGLHDMLGNVLEWTCSVYVEKYNGSESECASPASKNQRVLRGGAWIHYPWSLRTADRFRFAPNFRNSYFGFRVCKIL
jgi:formylglycine-generating enzyme required for sulfatase activity